MPRGSYPAMIKEFRSKEWYDSIHEPRRYTSHLLIELGRLGMTIHDIEHYESRGSYSQTVLSDLLEWFDDHPSAAEAKLYDWTNLNPEVMVPRLNKDRYAKPRIEVSAALTARNNLSVRWHPANWDWYSHGRHGKLKGLDGDFVWFEGDEETTWTSRSSNELMFIHGVGNLDPGYTDYGQYLTYNKWVVEGLLICAMRAAYENFIDKVRKNFTVTVKDVFTFETNEERQVLSWKLEDAAVVKERNERARLAALLKKCGVTVEGFVEALGRASPPPNKPTDNEGINYERIIRNLVKNLRAGGFTITPEPAREIWKLIRCYHSELLPPVIRRASL